jgi:hypothetical protein
MCSTPYGRQTRRINCKIHIYITSHFVKNKSDEIHMHHSTSQTDRPISAPNKKEKRGFLNL